MLGGRIEVPPSFRFSERIVSPFFQVVNSIFEVVNQMLYLTMEHGGLKRWSQIHRVLSFPLASLLTQVSLNSIK